MSADRTSPPVRTGKDERDSNAFSNKHDKKRHRAPNAHRIVVRDTRYDPPDARKLAEVIVSFAESLAAEHDETKHSTGIDTAEKPPAAA
ncbi:hypothetical protein ACWDSJ_32770 [Nocardia sp. NPDC003482]|jgi:hypothetical protein|uniref:Uncharacterized protein n=1 Tax=Nocardia cerradoensis TaxID=85688 RepID=A0A231H0S4_9NOCA|nr:MULTISPECIES: hypothetical protein [Nocardia]MDN2499307.1 hypothetical protein [Nocardia nova]OXR42443.1 hypothetical protein B7C42_05645 [Nocardia cerradoensis]